METIGILGGTFDPPHRGHLNIAAMTLQAGAADGVWMMVSPLNPFKAGCRMASPQERVEMCRLLLQDHMADVTADFIGDDGLLRRVCVSDFELSLPRPTYTADTLAALQRRCPDKRFRWIVGADNVADFHKWRSPEAILSGFGLIIYPRPGYPLAEIPGDILRSSVILEDMPEVEASSTQVRRLVAEGCSAAVVQMTSPRVARYIADRSLYMPQTYSDCNNTL